METSTETKPKTPPPQIVLALVVPALSAAKQMVQEINDLVEHVSVRKSECKALAVQATATIKAMEDMYPTTNDAQLKQSVSLLEKALSDILKEMRPWKNSYFRIRFKYWEIPNRVKFHQSDLDEALNVAKSGKTSQPFKPWNRGSSWTHGDRGILPLMTICSRRTKAIFPCPIEYLPGLSVARTGRGVYGRGGWSDVWRGELHDGSDGTTEAVAVKILQPVKAEYTSEEEHLIGERLQKRMHREVHAWHGLDHPCIVPLRGFALEADGTPWLISPWFSNGNVKSYTDRHPFADRWNLVRQVAEGLTYLHSQDIVHGDIKSANVLVNSNGDAALCDFGLSKRYKECTAAYLTSNVVMGALRWCAPEVVENPAIDRTEASDVYAFASVSLEILTGYQPFRHMNEGQALKAILAGQFPQRKDFPTLPAQCKFWEVLEACWKLEPLERPKMEDLLPETFGENM